jgi:hypothetical protein
MGNRKLDAMPLSENEHRSQSKSRHPLCASIDVVCWKNDAQMRDASVTIT